MPAEHAFRYAGIGDEAGAGLAEQVAAVRRLGWRTIELRTVDGVALADLAEPDFHSAADMVRNAGLDVVCLASRIGNWARPVSGDFTLDLHEFEVLAGRCAVLDTHYVRIMSYPNDGRTESAWRREVLERVQRLTERAEWAGVVLLHENCAGWASADADRMLWLLDSVDSPALRLLFDTGNGVAHGYSAYDLLAEIVPLVAHVHVKDAIASTTGAGAGPTYTLPGDGQARVADCLRLLHKHGYGGVLSIEPHLALLPHEHSTHGSDAIERFVAAGRRLHQLVRDELPAGRPR
ncbi:MAG: sugar phosphate isomerase/epimerase family protein [Sciscionella sp.]